jgi:hypothetical protein
LGEAGRRGGFGDLDAFGGAAISHVRHKPNVMMMIMMTIIITINNNRYNMEIKHSRQQQ